MQTASHPHPHQLSERVLTLPVLTQSGAGWRSAIGHSTPEAMIRNGASRAMDAVSLVVLAVVMSLTLWPVTIRATENGVRLRVGLQEAAPRL